MKLLRILKTEIPSTVCGTLFIVGTLMCGATARAQSVQYSPFSDSVEGNMPFTATTQTTIFAPSTITSTQTITFRPAATTVPAGLGLDTQTVAGYVTVSPSTVTFSPTQRSQTVTVTVAMPLISGVVPGTKLLFSWQVFTSGWTTAVVDAGYALNASVTMPQPANNTPPTVTITSPGDGSTFTYQATQLPTTIPLTFQAATASPLTINAIDATLSGPTLNGYPLTVAPSGLNTALATGMATMPIAAAGTYTITAHGFNGVGGATATSKFTVVVTGAAPTVTINNPPQGATYTVPVESPTVHVPFDFVAQSPVGNLKTVTVSLDNATTQYTVTGGGLNTPSLNGTVPIDLGVTAVGRHTIVVSAANDYGSASADTYYFITALSLPPVVDVLTPADGSTIQVTSLPVNVAFTYKGSVPTSVGSIQSAITSVASSVDDQADFVPSVTGLGTFSVNGGGSVLITTPGAHTIYTTVTNAAGTATDSNSFTVVVYTPPPTAKITSPVAPNNVFTYKTGDAAVSVPFTFKATSNSPGGIQTLTAQVDGVEQTFTPSGIGTGTATGTIMLSYTTGGTHSLAISATDDIGTATDAGSFTVNVLTPNIQVAIANPLNGAVIDVPTGYTTANVPFSFTAMTNAAFTVNSVSAAIDTGAATISTTTGANTASETASGTLLNLAPGTHTLTATGFSAGLSASTSVTFTVRNYLVVPPSVIINSPANGASFTRAGGGPALSIPLSFTGTSNMVNGVIAKLTATLQSPAGTVAPLTVSSTTLNQKVAAGSAAMTASDAGTYTIAVTATDAYGTASATSTFTVTVETTKTVTGTVFFDANLNAAMDPVEFGVAGIPVKLVNGLGATVGSTTTGLNGAYAIAGVAAGTYTVVATPGAGLRVTTSPVTPSITIPSTATTFAAPAIGLGLDFRGLQGMIANGYTIGFWKNNLDKAIAKKSTGTQVTAAQCAAYTTLIDSLALSPYDNYTMKQLSAAMGSNSSAPVDLLSKQLVAAEYNYENGAYLNGNKTLTFLFIWWGEYALSHPAQYSSTTYSSSNLIWVKDWFDAYNNTHGGAICGPNP